MNGENLTRRLLQVLNETSSSAIIDARTSYDYFYDAAKDWVIRTKCMTAEQTITTVDGTADYVLNGDYLGLYLKDRKDTLFIKLYDGSDYTFINFRPYSEVYEDNQLSEQAIASYFTVMDYGTMPSQITGAANADGAATGGKCTLSVAADTFTPTTITPGDIINNTTDGSAGVIVKYLTTKSLSVCLFGGTANDITNGDAFIIQPRSKMRLILDPPASTSGYSLYVPYLQAPAPVYSSYDVYRINFDYTEAFANFAAARYKAKDKQFDYGAKFMEVYLKEVDKYVAQTGKAFGKTQARLIPRWKSR